MEADDFFKMGCTVCRDWFKRFGATGPIGVLCTKCGTSGIVGLGRSLQPANWRGCYYDRGRNKGKSRRTFQKEIEMEMLKNCQAFDSDGYRTTRENIALDVIDGKLVNPWHYNQTIVLLRDKFQSTDFENTAEIKIFGTAWSLFVNSDELHAKAKKLNAEIKEAKDASR